MRSLRCSRTGSRKIRRSHLIFALSLLVPTLLHARIEHETTTVGHQDYLEVSIVVHGADSDVLYANLGDGMTARVEFTIRVTQPNRSPASFFGSRLLREDRVIYDLRWNPFRERYAITTNSGDTYDVGGAPALDSVFFTLSGYRIPWQSVLPDDAPVDGYQVETRVVYEPIVFVPGLTILSVFTRHARQTTPWIRTVVEAVR